LKPLHILQITNRIPWPLNDGGNIATYNVTRYLHRRGHRVELASLNTLKHFQEPQVVQEVDRLHSVCIDTSPSFLGVFKGLFTRMPYNVSRFWSEPFAELLGRILRQHAFDIVQLEGSYLSLYTDTIRKASLARLILRSHNVEHLIWHRIAENEGSALRRLYLRGLSKKIQAWELAHLNDYDAIIPIAHQDEALYRAQGFRKPMRTIHGGVDLSAFAPELPLSFNLNVGFLGSLEWLPNVQGLIWFLEHVWARLREIIPGLALHVAGKNPPKHLQDLSVEGMVFHGMVADAARFMEGCHFFIVPLRSGGGMRIKVIEAMAMGRSVVSTRIGAEGILLSEGEEITLADTAEEWVHAFASLADIPEVSLGIARKAMDAARSRFGLEAMGRSFEEFYREVLQ
jgi:polysaccharide biosynthesis protein PslH